MPKIILKSPFLKPIAKGHISNYVRYIATRENTMPAEDTSRHLPSTVNQNDIIQSMLRDFPDARNSFEYEDYYKNQTRGNASELISYVSENYLLDRSKYVNYIAERPRVEKISTHGLFTDEGVPIELTKVGEEIANINSNVWTHIISLKREDAERLGFNTVEAWSTLLRSHRNSIAYEMKIAPEDFRWYAAFHNESHHPHVHMIAYSVGSKGYLSVNGIRNIKSSLAKTIFAEDLLHTYEMKDKYRTDIKQSVAEVTNELVKSINSNILKEPEIENKLIELSEKLSHTSGKLQYGYLKANTKRIIDDIVDLLEKDEAISKLYDLWYEQKYATIRIYTDELPEKIPLSQNKEFKSIKNMIIQEALLINAELIMDDENEEYVEIVDEEIENGYVSEIEEEGNPVIVSSEYLLLLEQARYGTKWQKYALAKYLLDEKNEEYDPMEAVTWMRKSAEEGYSVAEYMMGKLFLKGEKLIKDVDEGIRWLERSVRKNNSFAQYLLGRTYMQGEDVEKDIVKGVDLLLDSADQDNKYAQYYLGKIFCEGKVVDKDIPNGIDMLEKSAENDCTPALYSLGRMYYQGEDVPKDIAKAERYLSRITDDSNPYVAYLLGKIYASESEIQDLNKAIECFLKAAEDNNSFALYQIGRLYYYGGEGLDRDYELAMEYLTRASDMGNIYAEQMKKAVEQQRNIFASSAALRIAYQLAAIVQNTIIDDSETKQNQGLDRKTRRKITEKKQAHGLKISMS